jgi:hypothetical protein
MLTAQIDYTANDTVPAYDGRFRYGANMGAYYPWRDEMLADIAAGNPGIGVEGVGVDALRPSLPQWFLEYWGYDIRIDAFKHYDKLGIEDNVVFVGYPDEKMRDSTFYCPSGPSELFTGMYLPIWDNGENGTPVNDGNHYALYLYKMVQVYDPYVKFWEIWNEPDFDFVGNSSKQPGEEGNWWEHDPDPCHYALHAPIQHYVRLLRISYEVIKFLSPNDYVAIGGIGYPSFLDVVLRNTDNPNGGTIDSLYPLSGGAYFDVVSYHSYPHIDNSLRVWDNAIFGFKYFRHSDRCVDGLLERQAQMRSVLKKYGYDNDKHPEKHWIITESNIPRKQFDEYIGSAEAQRNYLIKILVACQMNDIWQMHVYQLSEIETTKTAGSEFQLMGLYASLDSVPPYKQRPTEAGIAYKTTSLLLGGKRFDATLTAKMELPSNIRGGAFVDNEGLHTYVLWATTQTDRSEKASATYHFPSSMNMGMLHQREWNFAKVAVTTLVDAGMVHLTGTPVFLTDSRDEKPAGDKSLMLDCDPNPFLQTLRTRLSLPESLRCSLTLYDALGKPVDEFFQNLQLTEGEHFLTLDGGNLPSGMYTLVLESTKGRRVSCRLMKQ